MHNKHLIISSELLLKGKFKTDFIKNITWKTNITGHNRDSNKLTVKINASFFVD